MELDRDTLNELVSLLMPLMRNEQQRRALLAQALTNEPILDSIEYSGPTRAFVVQVIGQLADYGEVEPGKSALWALMETARDMVGGNRQKRIDELRGLLSAPQQTETEHPIKNEQESSMSNSDDALPPHVARRGRLMAFLAAVDTALLATCIVICSANNPDLPDIIQAVQPVAWCIGPLLALALFGVALSFENALGMLGSQLWLQVGIIGSGVMLVVGLVLLSASPCAVAFCCPPPTITPTIPTVSETPTEAPTPTLTATSAASPTEIPTDAPNETPTTVPTDTLTDTPSATPTSTLTDTPTSSPTSTPTATRTPRPTNTSTFMPTSTTSTLTATLSPTSPLPPSIFEAGEYLCEAKVIDSEAGTLNVVRASASNSAPLVRPITPNERVVITSSVVVSGSIWYQITYRDSQSSGWVSGDYIIPSENCP